MQHHLVVRGITGNNAVIVIRITLHRIKTFVPALRAAEEIAVSDGMRP